MARLARRLRLPRLTYQHVVVEAGVRVDFAYPHLKIAIEIDGAAFHRSREAWENDRARDTRLRALGWIVLRFTVNDIRKRPRWVGKQIRDAIQTQIRVLR